MKKKIVIFCFSITLIFTILSFIYYIDTFQDTTITVLGTLLILNLFIISEWSKLRLGNQNIKLWKVYFSVICSGIILIAKMNRITNGPIWIPFCFTGFIALILIGLNFLAKHEK
ncbi:hypothetical protein BSK63_07155 [Paenibacillus odorifer]|nr:hypothetical protein BSK63_07155 [Paenibacillus odorifer]OME42667.1 hypothetical protein BSK46_02380 [Paenibacillus odorifer]